jgi:hypothetical protein
MHLQNFNYNGSVIQRRADGFVNLTQMCQANGKRLTHWLNLKSTQDYIEFITTEDGITATDVIEVVQGGSVQGTWGHPELAIDLAKWISNEFRRWCNAHIFNLMASGSTSLDIDPIEEMKLKIELAKLERDKAKLENRTIELRHYVVTALPKPVCDRILGVTEIKEIEVRDRIIQDEEVIRDGSTINKTDLCHRLGILTRNGAPDYRKLNVILSRSGLPSEAFKLTASIKENTELRREYLEELESFYLNSDRQMWFGE